MYVAITRAEERLYLTRSKSRYLYGRRDIAKPSRFILELASELGVKEKPNTYCDLGERYRGEYYGSAHGARYSGYHEERSAGRALYSADDGYQSDEPVKTTSSFKAFWAGQKKAETAGNGGGKYSVGMKVRHPKFGLGMVIAVKNNGNTVNVAFDGQGIKELSASLAPLEIIK